MTEIITKEAEAFVQLIKKFSKVSKYLIILLFITNSAFFAIAQNFTGGVDDGHAVSGIQGVNVSSLTYYAYIKNVTASNADGLYGIGDDIFIQVEFDRTVYVSGGNPQINLETGDIDRFALYNSGNGTKILTFIYTVSEGDSITELKYNSTEINLSGARIYDIFNIDANLTLPVSGNKNSLSFNKDISIDGIRPIGSISLAEGQKDTSGVSPLNFQLKFTEAVKGLTSSDISLTGSTANPANIVVTGSDSIYNIAVSGMTNDGLIVINLNTDAIQDSAGNWNKSTTIINNDIIYDATPPEAHIYLANGQADTTNTSPVNFTVEFTENVLDFTESDIQLSGTAGASSLALSGGPKIYNISVNGISSDGTIIINIPENVCTDSAGNFNTTSLICDNNVYFDASRPGVEIILDTGQSNPTNNSVINFRAIFTENIKNFVPSNVQLKGSAGANTINLRGGPNEYTIEVSGMTSDGTVIVEIPENELVDNAGNFNTASINTSNQVFYDQTSPFVVISSTEQDKTELNEIPFTIEFSEEVNGFTTDKITIDNGTVTTLNETVAGIKWTGIFTPIKPGIVTLSVPENSVTDKAGNPNKVSNSFSIVYVKINHAPVADNQTFVIQENSKAGDFVGTVIASDPDGDNLSFGIISGNDDDAFEINAENGNIYVTADNILNYEIQNEYRLTIEITDDDIKPLSTQCEVTISILDVEENFEANNIITPNDARNKFWIIKNVEDYKDYELTIRTATGQIVYQTYNYNNDWDGRYNNKILPTGTYYFVLRNPKTNKRYSGFINLIKN